MLLLEVMVTRIFSVLFFHHFTFFAVSLIMTGLAVGGIAVSRWDARTSSKESFDSRLGVLALLFAVSTLAATLLMARLPSGAIQLSLGAVALRALAFLPGLIAAGAFLASAFSRREAWIGRLYAADLIAAAFACLAAIGLMRTVQGPAMLLVPAALAALAGLFVTKQTRYRLVGTTVLVLSLGGVLANLATDGSFLRLSGKERLFERWNEHSRIQARTGRERASRLLVIDRSAATVMRRISPEQARGEKPVHPRWQSSANYIAYRLGRPLDRVAIIGVGGGEDLRPPLAQGAGKVDGYELNQILIDLLQRDFRDYNHLASRPELELIHGEARVGIRTSGKTYDVIQASLIDTWAATASGGFVLSENGLYTLEGWGTFLDALTEAGILTMTRWLVADAPAETQRLVALAAEALQAAGIVEPEKNLLLVAQKLAPMKWLATEGTVSLATILISKTAFSEAETAEFLKLCESHEFVPLAAPGLEPEDPVVARLLRNAERPEAIADSLFDISPPTDLRPYFFLQIRPGEMVQLRNRDFGPITEITFNGIRVLMVLIVLALTFTVAVLGLAVSTLPSANTSSQQRHTYLWMSLYFFSIGLGYILIQLGLHQRLVLVLGHPTLVLSVVLFWMLLGTGLGSALSSRLFPDGSQRRAWMLIVAAMLVLYLAFPGIGLLERVGSSLVRATLTGALLGVCGFVLGCAFPIGVRIVGQTGEWAVQKMWAVNGAASIASSALAAMIGISFGSRAVIFAGVLAYVLMAVAGVAALRVSLRTKKEVVSPISRAG